MGTFSSDDAHHTNDATTQEVENPTLDLESPLKLHADFSQRLDQGDVITPEESALLKEKIVTLHGYMKMMLHPMERKHVADVLVQLQDLRKRIDDRRFGEKREV